MKTAASLLLVAVAVLWAVPAQAQISGSKHDFTNAYFDAGGGGEALAVGTETAMCAPCHTPHNSTDPSITVTNDSGVKPLWDHTVTTQSSTVRSGADDPLTTRSKLCLSCHDGSVAPGDYGSNSNSNMIATAYNVGNDLTNDHPVGVVIPSGTGWIASPTGVKLYGSGSDRVECQSCHDPHGTSNTKFLRVSAAASAICTACHDK